MKSRRGPDKRRDETNFFFLFSAHREKGSKLFGDLAKTQKFLSKFNFISPSFTRECSIESSSGVSQLFNRLRLQFF
jgi:hypothetical protein